MEVSFAPEVGNSRDDELVLHRNTFGQDTLGQYTVCWDTLCPRAVIPMPSRYVGPLRGVIPVMIWYVFPWHNVRRRNIIPMISR